MKKIHFHMIRLLAIGMAILSCITASPVQAEVNRDTQLRAAMIYNFARFTRWPEATFENTGGNLNICVSDNAPIVEGLVGIEGKVVRSRKIAIIPISTLNNETAKCHTIILTSNSKIDRDRNQLQNALYIAADEGVATDLTAIELVTVGRLNRFVVNPVAARKSGVEISSKLIDLAVRVR